MKVFLCAVVLLGCVLALGSALSVNQNQKDCGTSEGALSCHGAKIVRNLVKRLARSGKAEEVGVVKLFPGVEIVQAGSAEERERSFNEVQDEERTVFGRVGKYLQSHEIKINFGQLLKRSDIQDAIRTAFGAMDQEVIADVAEARKKDKGGLGAIMMMGLMMGKLLAALGFGGVGLLALKALGVSMVALLLSAILGLKKLTEQGDHKGRHNDEHFEVHSDDGHHAHGGARKRRSVEDEQVAQQMAYNGWAQPLN
uniref:Protein osiris 5 n=1 Tax=Anopheles atroparvus TaxID=41427 RepID=A0AAG5D1I3_ANOAO